LREASQVATDTGKDTGNGTVSGRVQILNPRTGKWVKLDTTTGRIVSQKKTSGPYKGITKK
jgi:hypothetical protein